MEISLGENGERTVRVSGPTDMATVNAPARPVLVSLEGSIGSGKSTLINALKERHPDWHFIDEPVSTWQALKNEAGEDLLQVFYKDIKRYSYTFQNCALLSRAINIQKKIDAWRTAGGLGSCVFVTERCLETDYHVFAQMLKDDGMMDAMEWDLYKMWYDYIKDMSTPLTGIIYVSTPPDICAERIKERGRVGEDKISPAYLVNLDKYQREWLAKEEKVSMLLYDNYSSDHNSVKDVERHIDKLQGKH